jgi:CubicO group peptidase (beta-lactamase class C family)
MPLSSMLRRTKIGLWKRVVIGNIIFTAWASAITSSPTPGHQDKLESIVDRAVQPVMLNYSIAGMAVGLTITGKQYLFNYGVASRATRKPVTDDTLFELGSITKTFTATLASYAQRTGSLSLADKTSKYLPSLQGSKFGDVTLLNLGTHTSGGFPLQLPESIIDVPKNKMGDYAVGYTEEGDPTRATVDVLSAETYGVKTTAADMLRFIEANMNPGTLEETLQGAIIDTHTRLISE